MLSTCPKYHEIIHMVVRAVNLKIAALTSNDPAEEVFLGVMDIPKKKNLKRALAFMKNLADPTGDGHSSSAAAESD